MNRLTDQDVKTKMSVTKTHARTANVSTKTDLSSASVMITKCSMIPDLTAFWVSLEIFLILFVLIFSNPLSVLRNSFKLLRHKVRQLNLLIFFVTLGNCIYISFSETCSRHQFFQQTQQSENASGTSETDNVQRLLH